MNLLVATSRQYRPEQEWAYAGTRRLMEESLSQRFNWALYDHNPDLLAGKEGRTHRKNLRSNSFHHVTLLPFSGVILAGTSEWLGPEMELLYGALSKREMPLWGMGLSIGDTTGGVSSAASLCLTRDSGFYVARDQVTQKWFRNHGKEVPVLPCPSLFAHRSARSDIPLVNRKNPRVGFVLQDSQRPGARLSEKEIRKICHSLSRLSTTVEISILSPTMDDFMRFSTMFPEVTKYSFESVDYLNLMAECDLIVTSDTRVAAAAHGVFKPALLIGEQQSSENIAHLPFTKFTEIDSLRDVVATSLQANLAPEIAHWKEKIRVEWRKLIARQNLIALPEKTSARQIDVSTN